jgi:hypothetical protein
MRDDILEHLKEVIRALMACSNPNVPKVSGTAPDKESRRLKVVKNSTLGVA